MLIPTRVTLVGQVATALRESIRAGEWTGRLPAERELAQKLRVSRMTLRAGVRILAQEKLIRVAQGRRAEIIGRSRPGARRRRERTVGLLSPDPILHWADDHGLYWDRYRNYMQEAGYRVSFHSGRRLFAENSAKALEALVAEANQEAWVLLWSNPTVQRWFAQRGIPAIVSGSCHPGVNLPALSPDYRALCRHAVGRLLALGHRRIVYLTMPTKAAGDRASEQGFEEELAKGAPPERPKAIVYTEETADAMRAAAARAFRGANPPTALITGRSTITLGVMTHLMNEGIRIPRDVSLISRDDGAHLAYVLPSVARYRFNLDVYARRLARMTLKLHAGELASQQHFVLPDFIAGDSIGPAPARA
ncbi:MAG: substrate-binding domain-containing protein [Opitutaceae bacterium]|nr:substrate-binding domain-containing protein [Opitutaceae bacterium]